jgi:hypothetical protein
MRQLRILCAAAFVAATAFAAASPAEAGFHVIRYQDTGFCQIWDDSFQTHPWPVHYTVMTHRQPTFERAAAVKDHLLHKRYCSL